MAPKKEKRVMTQEQLDRLAQARVKAAEVRQMMKEQRQEHEIDKLEKKIHDIKLKRARKDTKSNDNDNEVCKPEEITKTEPKTEPETEPLPKPETEPTPEPEPKTVPEKPKKKSTKAKPIIVVDNSESEDSENENNSQVIYIRKPRRKPKNENVNEYIPPPPPKQSAPTFVNPFFGMTNYRNFQ